MTYTVHAETPPGPDGLRRLNPWDGATYVHALTAIEIASHAFDSRDRRMRIVVLDHLDQVYDEFIPLAPSVPGYPQVAPADDGHVLVTFRWSTEHGECFECRAPAAWVVWPYGEDGDTERACAVCACNQAEDGAKIRNIADSIETWGSAPDEFPEG